MDQIQSMRVFLRVVEAGTFTKAAASLNMPKGTVTKLVQHLETRLKVKLLHRTTRRVTVTHDGAAYYERAARLLNELDEIEAGLAHARVNPSGRLRVDVPATIASHILVPALPKFFEQYPDIRLDLGVSDRPIDLIEENVDCVLRGGVLEDESLVARRIASLNFVTVAAPAYLARHPAPAHPTDLEDGSHRSLTFLSTRTGRYYPKQFARGRETFECTPPYQLAVSDGNAQLAAALAGLGISQLMKFVAQRHLESGALVEVLPGWTRPPMPAWLVYPPNRHLSAKVRAFVDWTADLFAQHPGL